MELERKHRESAFTEKWKYPIPVLSKCGVYKIQCNEYSAVYIGKIGRELKTRLAQHQNSNRSSFGVHILNSGHDFDSAEVHLLHPMGKGSKLGPLKIRELPEPNMNLK